MPSSLRTRTVLSAVTCCAATLLIGFVTAPGCAEVETDPPPKTTTTTSSGTGGGDTGGGGSSSGTAGNTSSSTPTSSGTGGTGATGGGGGTGGVPDPCPGGVLVENTGVDACPGDKITLDVGDKYCLRGDTSGLTNGYASFACGGTLSDGPDAVYEFDIKAPGSWKVVVKAAPGSNLDPTMYARAPMGCNDASVASFYGCWAFFNTDHEEYALHQPGAEISYLFIDGANGTSGAYEITVEYTAPICGDGILNPGEQCDDGNKNDNDGCTNGCKFDLISLFDKCDGEPVVLLPNQPLAFQGNTTPYGDDYIAPSIDGCGAQAGGKDRVYRITPSQDGTITASIGYDITGTIDVCAQNGLVDPGCWNRLIYAVGPDQCDDGMGNLGPSLACNQAGFGVAQITFPVQGAKEYYVVVDGNGNFEFDYGSYNLHLQLTP